LVLLFAAAQYISKNIADRDNKDITETLREMKTIIISVLHDLALSSKDPFSVASTFTETNF